MAIVDNGFDIALGLQTSLAAFKEFVRINAPSVHETIETFLPVEGDWRDLEEAFAYFDGYSAMDEAAEHLVGYGADDWSDAYHHAPQQEAERIARQLTHGIRTELLKWANAIDRQPISRLPNIPLPPNIPYLNFNYTRTLQRFFQIPERDVRHIHGQASRGGPLVLGHARQPTASSELSSPHNNEVGDVRMLEAGQILDTVVDNTSKPSAAIIQAEGPFFSTLANVAHITTRGHSLAEVDLPYFETVAKRTQPDAMWQISCYSDEDRDRSEHFRRHLSISCLKWSTFDLSAWFKWR